MSSYSETLDWLFQQLPMYQRIGQAAYKADLSNTLTLMEILEQPQQSFKSVHVAGTNGKGSSSHMLAAIFQEAGYKTGLYTSPHLVDFRERIRINGQMISEAAVVDFVEQYRDQFSSLGLSFFEMSVGLAFDYFRKEEVDIAIVEVGMGGRFDSTNVLLPELSLITHIGLDHTQFLGDTLGAIAGEKAGIIKPGVPVVISERQPECDPVFKKKAAEMEAPLFFAIDQVRPSRLYMELDLKGAYQENNLRGVLAAVDQLQAKGWNIQASVESALSQVCALTGLRGRWEILSRKPLTICDTGHNFTGIQALMEQIKGLSYRQLHIVWGMVGDKQIKDILRILPQSAFYYFTKAEIPRALDAETLKREALKFGLAGKAYADVPSAVKAAQAHTLSDDLIFIGGSTFVVADYLTHLA
ncbi:bifunctional folylpolyglutamate synthase/dihydrofolate synthase [Croceimicrobium hydrocarbonivorans]|nr:folylpolyglutamate synthase/dihydrofolate synthase family protein [Croceimicrobium hydrocarbonivorans]